MKNIVAGLGLLTTAFLSQAAAFAACPPAPPFVTGCTLQAADLNRLAPLASPMLTGSPTQNGQPLVTQPQLNLYAPLASPALTGFPTQNGNPLATLNSPAFTGSPTVNGSPIATGTPVYPGYVFASTQGVLCDGVHDDVAAINALLAHGGVVLLPSGNCMVSTPVTTVPGTAVILQGAGQGTTKIIPTASMAEVINFTMGEVAGRLQDFDIDDTAHGYATALINYSAADLPITSDPHPINVMRSLGLYCANSDGIVMSNPLQRDNNFDVTGNYFFNCTHAVHDMVQNYGGNSFISYNRIFNGGILLGGGGTEVPQGIRIISNNIFNLASGPCVTILGGLAIKIEENVCDQAGANSNGMLLDTTQFAGAVIDDVMITNNYIGTSFGLFIPINPNVDGIKLNGSRISNVNISGNNVSGWTGYTLNLNGTLLTVTSTRSAGPAPGNVNLGDLNINSSYVTLISPQFSSPVGIASSGGTFCRVGGTIVGTIAGTPACP